MHAVTNLDVYTTFSIGVATGGKHGKSQREIATTFYKILRGVWESTGGTAHSRRLVQSCMRIQNN